MRRGGSDPQRILATLLFTDIVGSTQRAEELGDARWRRLLTTHHRIVRRTLKEYRGRELDTAGDGFFALFDQPSDAIACTETLMSRLRAIDIEIRAGVHLGEVEVMGPTVGGISVHVAARVMSKAGPGQILVSSTVRDLMTGSDITFEDEGFHDLKGVTSQVHLFAVRRETRDEEARGEPGEDREDDHEPRPHPRRWAWALGAVALIAVVTFAITRNGEGAFDPRPDTVVRLNPADGSVAGGAQVGTRPTVIAYDGAGSLWVGNFDDKTVQRVDVAADDTADAAQGGVQSNPTGLTTGDDAVWVTNGFAHQLVRIDPGQANAATPIDTGTDVQGVAFGEDAVWVASPGSGELLRLDPVTQQLEPVELLEGSEPRDVAVGGGAVWVADWAGARVLRVDPDSFEIDAIALLDGRAPTRIAFGEGYVWVTSRDSDSLTRIDPSALTATTIEHVGNGPLGVAAGAGAVWVANSLDGTVARVDPQGGTVIGRTELGFSPDSVAVTPDGVWVSLHSL